MEISHLFKGILLGFSIAAPVGPIGVLCIRRTLCEGPKYGLVTGLGAASADTIYGMIAGFGITFISGLLISGQRWLSLVGGMFLCYLGMRSFFSELVVSEEHVSRRGLLGSYFSALLLTLTNPLTILSFAAIFAGMGLADGTRDYLSPIFLVCGVFIGSALWWLFLSGAISLLRARFKLRALIWVNKISGIILVIFGLLVLMRVV